MAFPSDSTDDYIGQYIDLTNVTTLSFWGYGIPSWGSMGGKQSVSVSIDGTSINTSTFGTSWAQYTYPISGYSGVHLVKITYIINTWPCTGYFDDFYAGSGSSGSSTTTPIASFTATPVNGAAPVSVQFTDTSSYSPTSWFWTFGDGGTSTSQNPSHTYTTVGTYDVTLTATNSGGSNSKTRSGFINVANATGALPNYANIYIRMANHDGILWDMVGNGTYYAESGSGGLNAIHLSTDPTVNAGQVTISRNQSGTIYATSSGTNADDVILMLAVNGTIPDDFAANIKSSGYTWTPTGSVPASGSITYQSSALSQTFTKKDLFYGPQNWKPTQGNPGYPLLYGEDMNNPANQFQIMFIDHGRYPGNRLCRVQQPHEPERGPDRLQFHGSLERCGIQRVRVEKRDRHGLDQRCHHRWDQQQRVLGDLLHNPDTPGCRVHRGQDRRS